MRKSILHIVGLGRTGTTLLDIVLGNGQDIRSCGELTRYGMEKGFPYQFPAGHPSEKFWLKVKETFEKKGQVDYHSMRWLTFLNDYHALFVLNLIRLLPKWLIRKYCAYQESLYDAVFANIDETTIIDSSKYPGRALTMSRFSSSKYEHKFVFLKKEPVSVLRSYRKMGLEQRPKSWFGATSYYFVATILCSLARWSINPRCKSEVVYFEDLVNMPIPTLLNVERALDIDLGRVASKILEEGKLDVGLLYYGNRVRLLNEVVFVKSDLENPLGLKEKLTNFLCKWLYR